MKGNVVVGAAAASEWAGEFQQSRSRCFENLGGSVAVEEEIDNTVGGFAGAGISQVASSLDAGAAKVNGAVGHRGRGAKRTRRSTADHAVEGGNDQCACTGSRLRRDDRFTGVGIRVGECQVARIGFDQTAATGDDAAKGLAGGAEDPEVGAANDGDGIVVHPVAKGASSVVANLQRAAADGGVAIVSVGGGEDEESAAGLDEACGADAGANDTGDGGGCSTGCAAADLDGAVASVEVELVLEVQ